jgi:type I restriction enzyme S subunit
MSGRPACDRIIPGRNAISVGDPGLPLKNGWRWAPLSELAELGTGHTPSRQFPEYWDGEIPWIGLRDANRHHGRVIEDTEQHVTELGLANSAARWLPKDTVCLSRTASVGYVVKMARPMTTSQDFVTWSCGGALDPDFLMQALLAEGSDIRRFGNGSTHTTIYFPEVKAFHIALPPLPEQRRIVAKLDALDARAKRARADLDRIPALVVRAKQAILAKAFEETSETRKVGELVSSIEAGKNLRCEERPPLPHERGVVKVSAVTWGEFNPDASKTLPSDFEPPEHTRIRAGDFLFSRANTLELVGACVIVRTKPENLFLSDKILRLVTSDDLKPWLLWFFRSAEGRRALENASSGNQMSMRNISQKALNDISVPFADKATRAEIVRRIESAFQKIDRIAADAASGSKLLGRLDQAILTKAFRGELVPQNPEDEPASILLERIRAKTKTAPRKGPGRKA